jgi:hypothetical protein
MLGYLTPMRTRRPSGHLSLPFSFGRRAVVVLVATAVVLAGCGRDRGADAPDASTDVVPGQPIVVEGRAGLVLHDLSTSGTLVFPGGSPGDLRTPADDAAVRAASDAVRAWLDLVLSERNQGLTTTVAKSEVDPVAFGAALGVDGPATDGVLDTQVSAATYLVEVAYLGQPGWALVRVESILVSSADPSTEIGRRLDSFVFSIDDTGAVEFLALEVAP